MKVFLLVAGLTTALATVTPSWAAEPTEETVVVQRNGDAMPPERGPASSVNREVKNNAPRMAAQGQGGTQVERAPVYRTLAEAAAAGVGVRANKAELTEEAGWHWWQWVGVALTALLAGGGVLAGWSWWRQR